MFSNFKKQAKALAIVSIMCGSAFASCTDSDKVASFYNETQVAAYRETVRQLRQDGMIKVGVYNQALENNRLAYLIHTADVEMKTKYGNHRLSNFWYISLDAFTTFSDLTEQLENTGIDKGYIREIVNAYGFEFLYSADKFSAVVPEWLKVMHSLHTKSRQLGDSLLNINRIDLLKGLDIILTYTPQYLEYIMSANSHGELYYRIRNVYNNNPVMLHYVNTEVQRICGLRNDHNAAYKMNI